MKCAFYVLSLLFASSALAQNQFVYTNDNEGVGYKSNTVSAFQVASDGSLNLIAGSPFRTGGFGGGNAIDPEEIAIASRKDASFLFAANEGSGSISAFVINAVTGSLSRVAGSPFKADGVPGGNYALAVSPNGKLLFATSDSTTVIHVYQIGQTGALTQVAGSPFDVSANCTGLKVTANGKYLVVAENSASAVGVYSIQPGGSLTAVKGAPFPASGTPYIVAVNCASDQVFVADNGSSSYDLIDAYTMAQNGSLSLVTGSPFSNGTSDVTGGMVLSPSGQYLFTSDSFSTDISSLQVTSAGGLSPVAGSPFPTIDWTGGNAVTQAGDFLYTVYFDSSRVDGRSINAQGELNPVPGTPFSTGQSQLGTPTLVTFPPPACPAQ